MGPVGRIFEMLSFSLLCELYVFFFANGHKQKKIPLGDKGTNTKHF